MPHQLTQQRLTYSDLVIGTQQSILVTL